MISCLFIQVSAIAQSVLSVWHVTGVSQEDTFGGNMAQKNGAEAPFLFCKSNQSARLSDDKLSATGVVLPIITIELTSPAATV